MSRLVAFIPLFRQAQLAHIGDLTKERVGAYLDHVRVDASKGDCGKVCAILKRLFGFFIAEECLESEPLRIERPKRLSQVVAKENARDWAIFMLLLDAGMRASELCNLRLEDVRWDRQELIIRPQIAKNRSFRVLPLFGSAKALRNVLPVMGEARCVRARHLAVPTASTLIHKSGTTCISRN